MNATAQASAAPVSGSKLDNRRVLAALIDLLVVAVGGAVILGAAGRLGDPPSELGGLLGLVVLGWALYYYFACESGNGQTLGKRAMKIRVVRTDGRPAGGPRRDWPPRPRGRGAGGRARSGRARGRRARFGGPHRRGAGGGEARS